MLRSPLTPILRSPLGSPLERRRGGTVVPAFDPVAVFGADLVTWYGNSIHELWAAQSTGGPVTLYQDSAGATPVTATGQSVGRVVDQSGNGYHLTQTNATSRPILSVDGSAKAFLAFDGTNDRLQTTSAVSMGGATAASMLLAYLVNANHFGVVAQLSFSISATGNLSVYRNSGVSRHYTNGGTNVYGEYTQAAGQKFIECSLHDHSLSGVANEIVVRANGTQRTLTTSGTDSGTGAFANDVLYVGRSGVDTDPFSGAIYTLPILIKRKATTADCEAFEAEVNGQIGAY